MTTSLNTVSIWQYSLARISTSTRGGVWVFRSLFEATMFLDAGFWTLISFLDNLFSILTNRYHSFIALMTGWSGSLKLDGKPEFRRRVQSTPSSHPQSMVGLSVSLRFLQIRWFNVLWKCYRLFESKFYWIWAQVKYISEILDQRWRVYNCQASWKWFTSNTIHWRHYADIPPQLPRLPQVRLGKEVLFSFSYCPI